VNIVAFLPWYHKQPWFGPTGSGNTCMFWFKLDVETGF